MTLSRKTPLRSDPTHTFPEKGAVRTCEGCGTRWDTRYYDDPPPWPCTGLKRGSGLQRSSRLSPVSQSNSGREHQKDEAFRAFVRRQPCVVCGEKPCDAAHFRSWGAGHGDADNLVSLCRRHHSEQHAVGIETFQERHDVDLEREASELGARYQQQEAA